MDMKKDQNKNLMNQLDSEYYEDEFNTTKAIQAAWKDRMIIGYLTGSFALIAIIYALFQPNIFSSQALLTAVDDTDAGSGIAALASRYGSLASAAGVSLPSAGASKADLIIATISSRDFFKHLLSFDFVLPGLMAQKSYNMNTGVLSYDSSFNEVKMSWNVSPPSYLSAYKEYLKTLNIGQDKRTDFITLEISHISPVFAHDFINLIVLEANNTIRARHLNESKIALDYLQTELAATSQREVQQSISQLVEAQLKIQMLANVRQDYMVRPIDPAFIPEEKSAPRKTRMVVLGTILGFIIGIFLSLVRQTYFARD